MNNSAEAFPEAASPLARRGFLAKSLAVSVTALAGGMASAAPPVHNDINSLIQQSDSAPLVTLVIRSETGQVFQSQIVPGSVAEIQDPKLGRLLRMEIVFDGLGKPEVSIPETIASLEQLAHVDPDKHRPPRILLAWGPNLKRDLAAGVFRVATGFSLFAADGTPLRAHALLDLVVLG
jgi:hypothetical protein